MAAICLLSDYIKDSKIVFVVGEGNSLIKEKRMEVYVKRIGFTNAKIIRGYSSPKKFDYDGYDVFSKDVLDKLMDIDDDKDKPKKEIAEFIEKETPFIIVLKPPWELIELWNEGFDMSKCRLAGYMSFNLRW